MNKTYSTKKNNPKTNHTNQQKTGACEGKAVPGSIFTILSSSKSKKQALVSDWLTVIFTTYCPYPLHTQLLFLPEMFTWCAVILNLCWLFWSFRGRDIYCNVTRMTQTKTNKTKTKKAQQIKLKINKTYSTRTIGHYLK
jgi:hypothetical protein